LNLHLIPQVGSEATYAKMVTKEDREMKF